jgi:hypothetical protein
VLIGAGSLVAIAVLLTADWYRTNQEVSQILSAEKAAWPPLREFADHVDRCGSLSFSERLTCFEDAATDALARLPDRRRQIAEITILPWHRAARRCRDRLVDYYKASERSLVAIVDGSTPGHTADSIRRSARRSCKAAIPMFSLFDIKSRVDEQF